MAPKDYPRTAFDAPAGTGDCKALLDSVPASEHPGGKAGAWKLKSKSGSGARVERVFVNASGLAALVAQTPGLLAVERLEASLAELEATMASPAAPRAPLGEQNDAPPTLEARAPSEIAAKVQAILAECEEGDDYSRYAKLVREAGATPFGSPLRVAVGNQFLFDLPPEDADDEPWLDIIAKGGYPSPDQPHWLEDLSPHFESPNESCTHLLHLDPAAALDFLLSNGFAHKPGQDLADVHPDWAGPLRARMESLALEAIAAPGSKISAKRGL